jgi:hypothetical protein
MSWIGRRYALDSQENSMASVNAAAGQRLAEQGDHTRSAGRQRTSMWLVVFLWLLVMIPFLWGVLMTLKEVRKFTG